MYLHSSVTSCDVSAQTAVFLNFVLSSPGGSEGLAGHSLGGCSRKCGPWIHHLGPISSFRFFPLVGSSAGFQAVSTYFHDSRLVSSQTSVTLVPTNTLKWQNSECCLWSTVVESVQYVTSWMSRVSSFERSFASWAPFSAAQSSNHGFECCFLGVTRDLARRQVLKPKAKCTRPSGSVD